MKIRINDVEKLEKALDSVQSSRCSQRLMKSEWFIEQSETVIKKIDSMLLKKDQTGINIDIDPSAQNFRSYYKGIPESTSYSIKKFSSGWFVVGIYRAKCKPWSERYDIRMSPEQKIKAVEYMIQYKNW